MTLEGHLRRLVLTAHTVCSVGWLGAVVAYLALAIGGLSHDGLEPARGAYVSMYAIALWVIVPASVAAILTGIAQAIGTEWGLFRHRWIVAKLAIGIPATIVLLVHLRDVRRMAESATGPMLGVIDHPTLRAHLVGHAGGAVVVLLALIAISIWKPWGRTRFGRGPEDAA